MSDILAMIQGQMKAPKDKRNDFGGYNYRTAEGILRAFKDVQPDDVSLTMSDHITVIADRLFLVATAKLHHGGAVIAEAQGAAMHALAKKGMDDAQITGACSSYARKYALCGLFAVDDSRADPDAKDNGELAFDPVAAHDRIAKKLDGAKTLADLAAAWKGEAQTIGEIVAARADLGQSLAKLKDDRKTELQPKDATE